MRSQRASTQPASPTQDSGYLADLRHKLMKTSHNPAGKAHNHPFCMFLYNTQQEWFFLHGDKIKVRFIQKSALTQ